MARRRAALSTGSRPSRCCRCATSSPRSAGRANGPLDPARSRGGCAGQSGLSPLHPEARPLRQRPRVHRRDDRGLVSPDRRPATFIDPCSPGGTPKWKASTVGPEMSPSPGRHSTASCEPRSSMPTGATPTISKLRTVLSATNHQRSSPRPSLSRDSDSDRTDFRGRHAVAADRPGLSKGSAGEALVSLVNRSLVIPRDQGAPVPMVCPLSGA